MSKTIKNNNNLWLRCGGNISRGKHLFDKGGIDQGFLDQLAIDDANYVTNQLNKNWATASKNQFNKAFSSENIGNTIGATLGAAGSMYNAYTSNADVADTSGIKNAINTFTNNPIEKASREALSNQWVNTINPKDDYSSRDFRSSDTQRIGNTFSAIASGASAGAQIGGPIGAVIGGVTGLGSSIAGMISGNIKARKEARDINKQAEEAILSRRYNNIAAAQQLDEQDAFNFLSNYYNNGGYMNLFERGGYLGQTHGSIFSNNVTHINEGNTHEMNPYEGVQIGVDQEGNPDLVEEGEVIFNDYVFSNRLYPTKEQLAQFNLPDKYDNHTFAWIATELSKESEERPNDNISINGLNDSMNKLIQLHELVRQENEVKESNKFGFGGDIAKVVTYNDRFGNIFDNDIYDNIFSRYTTNKIDTSLLKYLFTKAGMKATNEASKKKYNLTEGSDAWMDIFKKTLETELDKLYDKEIKIERQEQADQYLKDMGFNDTRTKKDLALPTGTGFPAFRKRSYIPDEYKKIYNDILNGRNTYIDGNLGTPIEDGKPSTTDAYNKYFGLSYDNYGPELKQRDKSDNNGDQGVISKSITETPETKEKPLDDKFINELRLNDAMDGLMAKMNNYNPLQQQFKDIVTDTTPLDSQRDQYYQEQAANVSEPKESFDYSTLLRYAPILGNALAYLGNRKDYTDVNSFMKQTANPRSVAFTPLGNYIRPEYISPWEMTNPIERQASATRSAIMNNSGNNRAAANAGLVGSDYNTLGLLGQALLQGKQYNNQQRLQAADFNRGTDQFNSQGAMQAQAANMSLNNYGLQRALQEYNMRNQIDMAYNQARSANLTSLFNNLGNIGRKNFIMNQINSDNSLRQRVARNGWSTYKG